LLPFGHRSIVTGVLGLTSLSVNKTQQRRLLARKATRVPTRSNTKNQISVKDFSPREIRVPVNPSPSEPTVKTRKLVQINIDMPESGNVSISPSMLSAGVIGGLTYWNSMQIEQVRVYSSDGSTGPTLLTVAISPSSSWSQPPVVFKDTATVGNMRAAIGFHLGLLDRARWFNTAATEELCVVASAVGETIIVQALISLISSGI